jgi:hypothetical protein
MWVMTVEGGCTAKRAKQLLPGELNGVWGVGGQPPHCGMDGEKGPRGGYVGLLRGGRELDAVMLIWVVGATAAKVKRRRSAAAANSPGSNSPRSASVVSLVSGRRRGRRESISVKYAEGRHSQRRGRSNNLKQICNGNEVNRESKGSLMRR